VSQKPAVSLGISTGFATKQSPAYIGGDCFAQTARKDDSRRANTQEGEHCIPDPLQEILRERGDKINDNSRWD